jgi:hypothetical protein
MVHVRRPALLVLLTALAVLPATRVWACTVDADCDNGDVCSVADVCSSGTCVLGGGGDSDANLVCDGEFAPGATINVTRSTLRKRTSSFSDNSSVRGAGDFVLDGSAMGAFTADDGFSLRVKDVLSEVSPPGDGIDATVTWAPGDCTTHPVKLTVSCKSPDKQSFLKFKPSVLVATQWTLSFKIKRLGNLTGPFFGPVRLVLTHDTSVHRLDQIDDCRFTKSGLKCREF